MIMERAWDDWSDKMKKQIKVMEKMKDKGVKIVDDGFEVAKDTMEHLDKTMKSKRVNMTDDYSDTEDNHKLKSDDDTDAEE